MLIPVHKCKRGGPGAREAAVVVGYAIVDDDMAHLANYFWLVTRKGYAWRYHSPEFRTWYMHFDVIGRPADGLCTSHGNASKLDNRRENLQHVTQSKNRLNQADKPRPHKTMELPRGISWDKRLKKYNVRVKVMYETQRGGMYSLLGDAVVALANLQERLGVS